MDPSNEDKNALQLGIPKQRSNDAKKDKESTRSFLESKIRTRCSGYSKTAQMKDGEKFPCVVNG